MFCCLLRAEDCSFAPLRCFRWALKIIMAKRQTNTRQTQRTRATCLLECRPPWLELGWQGGASCRVRGSSAPGGSLPAPHTHTLLLYRAGPGLMETPFERTCWFPAARSGPPASVWILGRPALAPLCVWCTLAFTHTPLSRQEARVCDSPFSILSAATNS